MIGSSISVDVLVPFVRFVAIVVFLVLFLTVVVIRFEEVHQLYGDQTAPPETKTNCPDCGARNSVDSDDCYYCGESLTEDTSDDGRSDR